MAWFLLLLFTPLLIILSAFLWAVIDMDASIFTSSKKKRTETSAPKKKKKTEEELYPKEIILIRDMLKGIMRESDIKDWTSGLKNEFSSSPFYTHKPTGISFEMWKYWAYLIIPDGTDNPRETKYGKDDVKTNIIFKQCEEFVKAHDEYIVNEAHRETLKNMCNLLEEKLDLPKAPDPNGQALLGYSGSMVPNPISQAQYQNMMRQREWDTPLQTKLEKDLFETLTGRR